VEAAIRNPSAAQPAVAADRFARKIVRFLKAHPMWRARGG